MIAAFEWIVDDDHIARIPVWELGQDRAYAGRHGPQVGRDVGGLRDQIALAIEDSAGEIEALFDVGQISHLENRIERNGEDAPSVAK